MRQSLFLVSAAAVLVMALGQTPASAITDDDVTRSIEKAREYLVNLQQQGGFWPEKKNFDATGEYGHSEMVMYTLAYIGEHPNRPVMQYGLDAIGNRPLDYTYAISMRTMALATLQNQLQSPKRDLVRRLLLADVQWLVAAQGSHGGWNYRTLQGGAGRYDLSNTQMAILALWNAALAGVEIPDIVWQRTQGLYYRLQKEDGAWNYGEHSDHAGKGVPGYGSMTAAGLASIYIIADMLDLNSGCPCRGSKSSSGDRTDLNRRIDLALTWLSAQFTPTGNPRAPDGPGWHHHYWLYSAERVGIAAGYKYFGTHNWYKEGAEYLVGKQGGNGSWGEIPDTCFAVLFLYKGRAPVLYQKLEIPKCEWNNHRRDLANLTSYIEKAKEQQFHWQIVSLIASVDELHEAPILYLSPETIPQFTADDKKKLRAFTDTGGTILVEASCGNPPIRKWFTEFAKEVWPEWAVKPLGPDHGSFLDPNPLKQRPEILGINDGIRTCVFYAMDDISCPWQSKAYAGKEYIFKWGINLFTYATDHSPLRAKLAANAPPKTERYASPVRGGGKGSPRIARLKHQADWNTGVNYKGFEVLAAAISRKANINAKFEESGAEASSLGDADAAYMTGSKEVNLAEPDRQALKAYLGRGGFLWAEASDGSMVFDQAFRKMAGEMGLELKPLPKDDPLMTGKFQAALGYDLTTGVQFRRVLKIQRLGRPSAELVGIYQDGKLAGVYSPFDVVFAATPYEAYACKGYLQEDAVAVATNILACISDRSGAK